MLTAIKCTFVLLTHNNIRLNWEQLIYPGVKQVCSNLLFSADLRLRSTLQPFSGSKLNPAEDSQPEPHINEPINRFLPLKCIDHSTVVSEPCVGVHPSVNDGFLQLGAISALLNLQPTTGISNGFNSIRETVQTLV